MQVRQRLLIHFFERGIDPKVSLLAEGFSDAQAFDLLSRWMVGHLVEDAKSDLSLCIEVRFAGGNECMRLWQVIRRRCVKWLSIMKRVCWWISFYLNRIVEQVAMLLRDKSKRDTIKCFDETVNCGEL